MLKGTTKSGFNFEINEKRINDWRLLRKLKAAESNPLETPALLDAMLGSEQSLALEKHLEDEEGFVDPDVMMKEIFSIFDEVKKLKNS